MTGTSSNIGVGQQDPNDSSSDFNKVAFQARQIIERIQTMVLVKVVSVQGGGGAIAAAGTVSVQPLVSQINSAGNTQAHGVINGIPWWRLQGGSGAIVCDPVAGDIGYVQVASRDISAVKETKAIAAPGSFRKFDLADGIYVGGVLNGAPTQFITFTSTGIAVVDINGNEITMSSSGIAIFSNSDMQLGDTHGNLIAMSSAGMNLVSSQAKVTGPLHVTGAAVFDSSIAAASAAITGLLTAGSAMIAGALAALNGVFGAAVTAVGAITAGFGTGTQVGVQTHTHVYLKPATGAFDNTSAPNEPS